MNPPKVYYTSMRCEVGDSLLDKLERLVRAAGIENGSGGKRTFGGE